MRVGNADCLLLTAIGYVTCSQRNYSVESIRTPQITFHIIYIFISLGCYFKTTYQQERPLSELNIHTQEGRGLFSYIIQEFV